MILEALDRLISRLEGQLAEETAFIAAAVAAKQIGHDGGHWKRKHRIENELLCAQALRDAFAELVR
jgi:hypothetical protein